MKYIFAFLTLVLVLVGSINIFYEMFDYAYTSSDFLLLTLLSASFTKLAE